MLRWGIMGTGSMAATLVPAIRAEQGEVTAVGSADLGRAEAFARHHGVARAVGHHHDVLGEAVDVVYVATTHDRHARNILACIEAGIPVLAEKPLTLHHAEAEDVVRRARAADVFLMEAMWMRFQPAFLEVERLLAEGVIGRPTLVQADFGIAAPTDPKRRWFSRDLGGGSLLDGGIYPLTLAVSLLGTPTEAHVIADLAEGGIDRSMSVAMRHVGGLSSWCCSFVADSGIEAMVAGPDGSLRMHAPFHRSGCVAVRRGSEVIEERHLEGTDGGHRYEVREVERCLANGLTESPQMPLSLTLTLQDWLSRLRASAGA